MKRGWTLAWAIFMALSLVASACSSAPYTPTQAPAAPAKGSENTRPLTAATPAVPQPAATAAAKPERPAASPAASADWKTEWDKIVVAAKKEGKVVVGGARGEGYTNAAREFTKAYPDIKIEYTAMAGVDAASKILAERRSGLYLWDVYLGGSTTMLDPLIPEGVFEPLRPNLMLPEVLDDTRWRQGFDDGWQDSGQKYAYAFLGYLSFAALVNRDVPGASALKSMDDLMDPKWKGMIMWQDPRIEGSGNKHAGNMYVTRGAEWLRKVLSNDIVPLKDARMVLERVVRGAGAIAIGAREDDVGTFRNQGLLKNFQYIDDGTTASAHVTGGSGDVAAMDRPPHPNAQIVFINWLLSKQGQEVYVKNVGANSRRLDVPPADEASLPKPGLRYSDMSKEDTLVRLQEATKIAEDVLK